MKKIAIINKVSYDRKSKREALSILNGLSGLGADIKFTEYSGHGAKIARDSRDYKVIIAGGGGGSVSEVVNNMDLDRQTLAILPLGTGNSLARDLGVEKTVKAIDAIRRGQKDNIDIIKLQITLSGNKKVERYVATTSGAGFACETASFGNRYLKKAGPLCYILAAVFKTFNLQRLSARVQIDDSDLMDTEFTNFFVNNARYSANMCLFPKADVRDGAFNFLFTRTNALTQCLWDLAVLTRTYFYYPGEKSGRKLRVSLNRPAPIMTDGEIFDHVNAIEYSVLPLKLSTIVGR